VIIWDGKNATLIVRKRREFCKCDCYNRDCLYTDTCESTNLFNAEITICFFNEGLYQDGVRKYACIQPCDTMGIVFGYPSKEISANKMSLKLYFKNNIPGN
jgi:hypothetical protein